MRIENYDEKMKRQVNKIYIFCQKLLVFDKIDVFLQRFIEQ